MNAPIRIALATLALLGAPALAMIGTAAFAAGAPQAAEVDELKVCLECHDLADALAAKVKHPPAAEGDCSACHNPHVSRLEGLLLDQPGPLCARCHEDVTAQLARKVVHAPVAEARCAACHSAHGAPFAGLLARPATELCQECHEIGRAHV